MVCKSGTDGGFMETRWTRGPWVKDYGMTVGHIKSTGFGEVRTPTVCRYDVLPDEFMSAAEKEANAHLISAALVGFEAANAAYIAILKSPVNKWRVDQDGTLAMLRDYIAKATNQEPEDVQNFYERKVALAKVRGETNDGVKSKHKVRRVGFG